MSFNKHLKKYFPLITLALLFYSCGVWGNFTTYFNLYYNTQHLFNEAEASINEDRSDIFTTAEPRIKSSDEQKLQMVIEKCSRILQFNSETKYVDDAMLILGKSFYYQQNYLKASREFEELLQTQPDSDLRLEAQLWLGKSQLRLNNVEEALATLKTVHDKAIQLEENDILESALIEEIKYKVSNDDISGAIKAANDFLNVSENDDLNQKISYEMAKLNEELNNYEEAINAYQKVLEFSPAYKMELDAKLALGKVYISAGYYNKAYSLLDDMSSLEKNNDALDRINLEKGISLVYLNRYNDAIDIFTEVDTAFKSSEYGGAARFEIGQVYENVYNNYDSASVYYTKASSSLVPTDYIDNVRDKIRKFSKYNDLVKDIKFNKIEYEYAQNPEKFIEDSTKFYDRLKKTQEELANNNSSGTGDDQLESGRDRSLQYKSLKDLSTIASLAKPPVRPTISSDSIKTIITKSEFDLGNLFFSEFDKPDSAYYYYNKVLQDDPPRHIKANTLFVLGNYFLTEKDSLKADSLFNVVYSNFKDQSVANSAAAILNKPLINFDYDPAQELYVDAEKQLLNKNYQVSLEKFKNIYENYPNSPRAPKALYASGWVLENDLLKPDSAALFYDTLKVKYPGSVYAVNITPKLEQYHIEKEKTRKAAEDSLKILKEKKLSNRTISDSTKSGERNLSEEQLKKLPPGLRFEAKSDSTGKKIDETKDFIRDRRDKIPEDKGEILKRDTLLPKIKSEPPDTLRQ